MLFKSEIGSFYGKKNPSDYHTFFTGGEFTHTLEIRVCQWSDLSMYASVNGHQRRLSSGSAHELSLSSVNPWEHFSCGK